ncbi:hypothetical protein E2C01_093346 [Portunus trituberculatus]|uniref:Uncharacterized protein n=1 Tax=Portunus trituberculatus TaxID=210409 RepID=A0A5B7JXU9_PORTR|nr:hypothetical protein [Portunus trituberculatus]
MVAVVQCGVVECGGRWRVAAQYCLVSCVALVRMKLKPSTLQLRRAALLSKINMNVSDPETIITECVNLSELPEEIVFLPEEIDKQL